MADIDSTVEQLLEALAMNIEIRKKARQSLAAVQRKGDSAAMYGYRDQSKKWEANAKLETERIEILTSEIGELARRIGSLLAD